MKLRLQRSASIQMASEQTCLPRPAAVPPVVDEDGALCSELRRLLQDGLLWEGHEPMGSVNEPDFFGPWFFEGKL